MEIDPRHLQIALSLAHLQGVAHGHALASQKAQKPKPGPKAPTRKPINQPKPPMARKQNPKAQGPKGKAQGRHGSKGPLGGTKARQNNAGTLPHQDPLQMARKAYGG
jgi:hypothetical protein